VGHIVHTVKGEPSRHIFRPVTGAYKQKIVYLEAHLKRLQQGAALICLKCPYPAARLKKNIRQVVEMNGFSDSLVRVSLWKAKANSGILISAEKYKPYPLEKYKSGFSACVSNYCQNAGAMLARLKTMNHLFYRLASLEAEKKHCDEALILNNQDHLAEASRSNLFFVKDNRLFTPGLECGCLDGITRKTVLELAGKRKIEACQGNFKLQDLYDADEAFLTNSLMGIMPLASVEGHKIAKGPGKFLLTQEFLKKYNSLISHGD